MQRNFHINPTWAIVSIVIIGNIFLFQSLFNNVETYSEKVVSTRASKYDLDEI